MHPIQCLAIVNRGEAAMRCIRAVKALCAVERCSMKVVALYTDPDRDAPFVRHADHAWRLPSPGGAVRAYLDHDVVLEALEQVGADAVWPGWGFVAEDPRFVERLAAAGIRFLGPSADTMRRLGDKIASKLLAERVGVPVTAWSGGVVADERAAAEHAARIGYPLVVKASAGGGGRGIRLVEDRARLDQAFRSAASEAQAAFGDGRLFMEAFVGAGRHIEVQIVADSFGRVAALGSRDCSVQRRHQKVLEETPPVGLARELLAGLEAAAVSLASEVGYCGVGTVEFLVDAQGFYFLEMNPRLQVEHGITEEVFGVDLVQLQVRIARGEPLPELPRAPTGHAIEARLCAEDPDAGFLPAPGRIARFDPALGTRVRIDTGVVSGTVVPPDFDSLIAKVIACGDTREEARARLLCALRDFDVVIEGGATNKGYLMELLEAEECRRGGVDTRWLDRYNEGRQGAQEYAPEALVLAAILAYQDARRAQRANFYADVGNITPEKIPKSIGQEIDLSYRGHQYRVRVFAYGSWRYRIHYAGRVASARLLVSGDHVARLLVTGRDLRVVHDITDTSVRVEVEGRVHRFGRQTAGQVRAAAPSLVVALSVQVGERVEAGAPLGLLEAMKMEIGFSAPVGGVVKELRVRPGQQVAAGDVLLVIDAAGESEVAAGRSARVQLPEEGDPLSLLFLPSSEDGSQVPDVARVAHARDSERRAAVAALGDEIRRLVQGYDVFEPRVADITAFLEAPLPPDCPESFRQDLSTLARQLVIFGDIERLFSRAQTASESGEISASNNARMRMFLRRMSASGAGIAPEFLRMLEAALVHYDYGSRGLRFSESLQRAILRMFASQVDPGARWRLILGVLRRMTALAETSPALFSANEGLRLALQHIAALRGQVPDALADAAIEAQYTIYQRPELDRLVERTSQRVEAWLAQTEHVVEAPPEAVLAELAGAPRRLVESIQGWLHDSDARRRSIALGVFVRRLYVPRQAVAQKALAVGQWSVDRFELLGGPRILGALVHPADLAAGLAVLLDTAQREETEVVELVVATQDRAEQPRVIGAVLDALGGRMAVERLTVSMVGRDDSLVHETFTRGVNARVERSQIFGMHPEAAARVDLQRLGSFVLERQAAEEGIYCFLGVSREDPGDERLFVLGDVRGRPPEPGYDAQLYTPIFERAFYEAARTLRMVIGLRDPRRRLQWNRIMLFLANPIVVTPDLVEWLSRKLHPATRHLGLERVVVRLRVIEAGASPETAREVEVVVSDLTGSEMSVSWREPHHAPLVPVSAYERNVVSAKRRRLLYPYEIIRLLAKDEAQRTKTSGASIAPRIALPEGRFEEYDLDPHASTPRALSVAGRKPGLNTAAVVFGVVSTPTEKVPEGMRRVLVLSDPTLGMGALASAECDRVVGAIDLAERLGVPVEWIPVSSGARIAMDSGTENLDATARVVRRIVTFTEAGGVIHVIVTGVNVGAQSYWDALATMLMHTRGVLIMTPEASMVLTGRAALAASGSVSAEDEVAIGGYERIMGPNGQAQYHADDISDAYRILYQHYAYTYVVPGEAGPRPHRTIDPPSRNVCLSPYPAGGERFSSIGQIFDADTNPGRKYPFAMRALMQAVIDQDGGHLERWHSFVGADTAIVWDAHLGGHPVCLIGIESQNVPRVGYRPQDGPVEYNGGTLFPLSSKKVARALNAASGVRPVVVLANLSGFDGSPESMRKLQLEYGAEIARAVVRFQGKIVFLVVSRYHGGAYVVFSQELNPGLRSAAVEGSYASVIGGGPAATVVFSREVHVRVAKHPRVVELRRSMSEHADPGQREALESLVQAVTLEEQSAMAAEFDAIHSVERARRVGSLSDIIGAPSIRSYLVSALGDGQ